MITEQLQAQLDHYVESPSDERAAQLINEAVTDGFKMTDPETWQLVREEEPDVFTVLELSGVQESTYDIYEIDLSTYSDDELETYCKSQFPQGLDEVRTIYGGAAPQVLAEIIAESSK